MGSGSKSASTAGGALGGASAGAGIGTALFPGIGTAIGAGLGGLAGGIGGYMSGGGSWKVPQAAVRPLNAYTYQNGALTASMTYNPKLGGYQFQNYLSPQQKAIYDNSEYGINNTLTGMSQALGNLSPATINQYEQEYMTPQVNQLNRSYNDAYGAAADAAGANGTLGSVGFDRYLGNNLEYNRAQSLANIQANAAIAGYNLPNLVMLPYVNELNTYQNALNNDQSNFSANQQPLQFGAQSANNFNLQNYPNLLNQYYTQNPFGSFFGWMNGGY